MVHDCACAADALQQEGNGQSQDSSGPTPGHSSMAEITPVGLRLYDAEGTCSIVPLEELRQMMQRLTFSRSVCGQWLWSQPCPEGIQGRLACVGHMFADTWLPCGSAHWHELKL